MKNSNENNKNNKAKAVILGAGAIAGIATAVALMDKKNRKNISKKLDLIQEKGDDLKGKIGDALNEKINENPEIKKFGDGIKDELKS